MKIIVLFILLAFYCAVGFSQTPTSTFDGINYQPIYEVAVSEGSIASGDIVIPDEVEIGGIKYRVTEISRGAFGNGEDITSIKLGFYVKVFKPYSIYGSFSKIELNPHAQVVDPLAFYGCPNLEYIDASDCNYLSDDDGVLYDKYKSELIIYPTKKASPKYVIPEGVKYISGYAFWETKVSELDIPSTVWFVGGFDNAPNLTKLVVRAKTPPTLAINRVDNKVLRNCILYVPGECAEEYRSHKDWGLFKNIKSIDEFSDIETVRADNRQKAGIYSLNGERRSDMETGVNVVVSKEGTAKKIIHKKINPV